MFPPRYKCTEAQWQTYVDYVVKDYGYVSLKNGKLQMVKIETEPYQSQANAKVIDRINIDKEGDITKIRGEND